MIVINCTKCRRELSMDEAFAGGTCRCQHCGTIQTVPAPGEATASQAKATKTLYRGKGDALSGTGLDQLADIVASSGLSSGGLLHARPLSFWRRWQLLLSIGGGAVLLVVLGVIILAVSRGGDADPYAAGRRPVEGQRAIPGLAGIPLAESTIVFVVDRGEATAGVFTDLLEATQSSLYSLGPERRFQLLFWDNSTGVPAYPSASLAPATPEHVEQATEVILSIVPGGATDVRPALEQALVLEPASILLATGKGYDLDETFVEMVLEMRGRRGTRIHALSIGGPSEALQTITSRTGGTYREITPGELRGYGR